MDTSQFNKFEIAIEKKTLQRMFDQSDAAFAAEASETK